MEKQQFLSEFLVRNLAESVTGNDGFFPYKKWQELVGFFSELDFIDDFSESVGNTRIDYARGKIRQVKDFGDLKKLIEAILAPKEFYGCGITIENIVIHMNGYLKFEGYEVRHDEKSYRLFSDNEKVVEHKTTSRLSYEFIAEQIEKCEEKLSVGDYDGAITNARSLIEAVSIKLIETKEKQNYKSSGSLIAIFKDLKKALNMAIDKERYPPYLIEILSGLGNIVQGMAELTNKAGDRHNRVYKPQKHHAKLAVNCAFSFCDFILESFYYQQGKTGGNK